MRQLEDADRYYKWGLLPLISTRKSDAVLKKKKKKFREKDAFRLKKWLPPRGAPAVQVIEARQVLPAAPQREQRCSGDLGRFLPGQTRVQSADFGGDLFPLGFIPPVLEPDFHLRLGELQVFGQVGSLGGRQVFLVAEFPLQFDDLGVGERRPRALRLLGGVLGDGQGSQGGVAV